MRSASRRAVILVLATRSLDKMVKRGKAAVELYKKLVSSGLEVTVVASGGNRHLYPFSTDASWTERLFKLFIIENIHILLEDTSKHAEEGIENSLKLLAGNGLAYGEIHVVAQSHHLRVARQRLKELDPSIRAHYYLASS
ncbi:MAG: hypothetical protein BWY68_00294 [bacterium ADurb.Bin400]|nr:MAG: hypothetical protein BWY68_00294 [bacterium ADurb.Bin400]